MTSSGLRGIALAALVALAVLAAPTAHADEGSYLAYLRGTYPAETGGIWDGWLLLGGSKACAGDPYPAPGVPALSAAVVDAAHRELCP